MSHGEGLDGGLVVLRRLPGYLRRQQQEISLRREEVLA
jgi:hypothetical protein